MRFKEEIFQKIPSQTTELSFAVSFPEFLTDILFKKIKNESFKVLNEGKEFLPLFLQDKERSCVINIIPNRLLNKNIGHKCVNIL